MLDRRPVLAGVLFGLLAYKPQFGLMVPLVLAVSGRWRYYSPLPRRRSRCLRSRPPLAFGPQVWSAFLDLHPLHAPRRARSRATPAGTRFRACSPGRACGAARSPSPTCSRAHWRLALAAALVSAVAQRRTLPLKAAALCLAAILATPYSLRLRHDDARARHRVPCRRRIRRGFAPVGKDGAGRALDGAARRAQCRTSRHSFRSACAAMLAMFILLIARGTHRTH